MLAYGQQDRGPRKHNFGFGPLAGYNFDIRGFVYGAGLLYEYRPFGNFGLTGNFLYERTTKDIDDIYDEPSLLGDVWIHETYALSLLARFYMSRFYVAGSAGVGHDNGYFILQNGQTADGGSAYGLFKDFGAGYQIPLKNGDELEIELNIFGTRHTKVLGIVRYKFRR